MSALTDKLLARAAAEPEETRQDDLALVIQVLREKGKSYRDIAYWLLYHSNGSLNLDHSTVYRIAQRAAKRGGGE